MTLSKALLMAILLVSLGSYAYYQERKTAEQDEAVLQSQEELIVFPGLKSDELTGIRVIGTNDSYRMIRDGEKRWVLHEPAGAEVDPELAQKIVTKLIALKSENTLQPEEIAADQEVYGLVPPQLVLTLDGTFGRKVLSFGKKHSLSARRYAQPEEDGRIFLVDDTLFALIAKSKDEVRNRFPARFAVEKAVQITAVTHERPPLLFRKSEDPRGGPDRWTMIADGREVEADSDLINKELNELSSSRVAEFVDGPLATLAPFGLVRPKLILSVQLEGEAPGSGATRFQIGQGVGVGNDAQGEVRAQIAYYLKLPESPTIFRLERPVFSDWLQPPEHFRDRTPFDTLSSDDLKRIHVKRGAGLSESWSIVRDTSAAEERWIEERSNAAPRSIAQGRLDAWLETLFRLQVLSYPALENADPAAFGLTAPVLEIVLEPSESGRAVMALTIAGEVQAAGEKPAASGASAPRYGAVRKGDEQPVPVVLSGATLPELDQGIEIFVGPEKR